MSLKTLIMPILPPTPKYGYYVVLQQILRKRCFFLWLWWHLFDLEVFGKMYGLVLSNEF